MPGAKRYLPDVLDSILAEIPADEELLRQELSSVKNSALYAAPESMRIWWARTAEILSSHDKNQPWMDRVFCIIAVKKDGEVSPAPNLS